MRELRLRRSPLNRNSTLASGKPLKRSRLERKTRLRHGRGTSFKLTADDIALWWWLGELTKGQRLPCDGCGVWRYLFRCHLLARGNGGRVVDNIALLDVGCHEAQEKRTDQFNAEMNVDLYAIAAAHTAQWQKETGQT